MVRVPALIGRILLVVKPVVAVKVVPLMPLVTANEPANELEPVPEKVARPAVLSVR